MKTDVTQQQLEEYQENGFIIIEDFLSEDELASWREMVDEAVAQRGNRKLADGSMEDGEDEYYDNVFVQRINLWQDHQGIREIILNEKLGKMAATLAGVDGIRVWHDQALIKQPYGNPTGWHLDNPYWSFHTQHSLSIWVALDDATLENGCLYFLPGTHKLATFDNVDIGANIGGLFEVYPEWRNIEPVPAVMKAGSCSFHNGLTAHGAGANMTPHPRRAMSCAFMPDGSVFNGQQNILTDKQIAALEEGQPIQLDDQTPLIYHNSKSPSALVTS